MGASQTNISSKIDIQYKMIRRYYSQLYLQQITIVQHKQTKQHKAMIQLSLPSFKNGLILRKLLSHPNLIQMTDHYLQQTQGMCSGMTRHFALFEYHQKTLQDLIIQKQMKDKDIKDFLKQMSSLVYFLQKNNRGFLIYGLKSISVTQQQIQNYKKQTLDDNSYKTKSRDTYRCSLAQLDNKNIKNMKNKRLYKLFQPLQCFNYSKQIQNIHNLLELPLHPTVASSLHNMITLSEYLIKLQNIFSISLIALSLMTGQNIQNLNIYKNNKISINSVMEYIESLNSQYPKSSKELIKLMKGQQQSNKIKIKQFKLIVKKEKNNEKQNNSQIKLKCNIDQSNISIKKDIKLRQKKISLMRLF